jgi:hypothetical protein
MFIMNLPIIIRMKLRLRSNFEVVSLPPDEAGLRGLRILARMIARCRMEAKESQALHDHSDKKSLQHEDRNEFWRRTKKRGKGRQELTLRPEEEGQDN